MSISTGQPAHWVERCVTSARYGQQSIRIFRLFLSKWTMPIPEDLSSTYCRRSVARGPVVPFRTASTVIGFPKLSVKSPVSPGCLDLVHGAVSGSHQRV